MQIKLLVIAIILGCSLQSLNAKFHSINTMYGISMRETTSICKDETGFIWASAKSGILRFTEDEYTFYHLDYESTDLFSVRLAYRPSLLIAYTNNGQIFRYNILLDKFELLINLKTTLNNIHLVVNNMLIDEENQLWIPTSSGLFHYHCEERRLSHVWNDSSGTFNLGTYTSTHFFMANAEGIWLVDFKTLEKERIHKNNEGDAFTAYTLFYDPSINMLLVGTRSNGIFRLDLKTRKYAKILPDHSPTLPVLSIVSDTDSTLLVGIDGQGIWELNKNDWSLVYIYKENIDDPESLPGDGVHDLFCDQGKRIWVCSYSGGVSFFEKTSQLVTQISHRTNNSNSLVNNNVNAVIEDRLGTIWFATNNGISCWQPSSNQWKAFYNNKREQAKIFHSLCEDDEGRIWAGSYSSGAYVIDSKTKRELIHYKANDTNSFLSSDFIFGIYKDHKGKLWFGGIHGDVVCYDTKEKRRQSYPIQAVTAFAEADSTQLLFACMYGLSLLTEDAAPQLILDGYMITDLFVDNENIWICTNGDGLLLFNLKRKEIIERITVKTGLPSNYVNSIVATDNYLWLGTESGFCRLNPKDKSVVSYSSSLSLPNVSFNKRAVCKLRNGHLIWGTNNGAIMFDPSTIQQVKPQGQIFFQNLTIAGRAIRDNLIHKVETPLNDLDEIRLKYPQNTLALELLSIGMAKSGSKFSWKMEGLDDVWSQPSTNRILSYSNIPSGNFLLKIRLYDNDLSQIIQEREMKIHIIPPFWATWWFRLFMTLTLIGVAYFVLHFYINRLKQRHAEEKIRFFTNTAHDIRTSLTLIKGPVEELKKEPSLSELGRRYLQLATEQSRRLSTVVTQLMDFQKVDIGKGQLALRMVDIVQLVSHRTLMFESYAKVSKIELVFMPSSSAYLTAIDELKIEKAVDNLISNAIKYSHPNSKVKVVLDCNQDGWKLEVIDQGIGISHKAQRKLFKEFYRSENAVNSKIIGSGIGLLLIKHYVVMHGGSISFSSQENEGSTFRISIPFKEVPEVKKVADSANTSEIFTSLPASEAPILPQKTDFRKQAEMSILIVEDNPDLQGFIGSALCEEYQVLTADDGAKGWEIVRLHQPDLVISDVMMPNMDGFEFCRRMKSTYETSHIPIILLTSLSEKAQQLHGLGLGADDYLMKPFDMTLLSLRIKCIIKNREVVRNKALMSIKEDNRQPILDNDLNDQFVKKALETVRQNMSNSEFDKEEFALAMHVSPSLLYKKVKTLTGQSPVDLIRTIRMNHAMELLQSKASTITEISEMCGFSSVGYFSTTFRKHFGKAPSEVNEST